MSKRQLNILRPAPKRERVLALATKLCGVPPRVIRPEQYQQLLKISGLHHGALHIHLNCLGYSRPRVPKEVLKIIADFLHRIRTKRVGLDVEQEKVLALLAKKYYQIGRPPPSWEAVKYLAAQIRPKLPPWPPHHFGRRNLTKAEFLQAVKKVCGNRTPRALSRTQFLLLVKKTGLSTSSLSQQLTRNGFSSLVCPSDLLKTLIGFQQAAEKLETREEVKVVERAMMSKLAKDYRALGLAVIAFDQAKRRLREVGLPWPNRPPANKVFR